MPDVFLGHTFLQRSERGAEHFESRFASKSHEFEFVRGLVPAARNGDGIGGHIIESRSGLAEMIEESEASGFFHADAARANTLIGKRGSGNLRWALIFLPDSDFEWKM